MKRRDFIAGLGGAAMMPLAARAQSGPKRRVGVLLNYSEASKDGQDYLALFRRDLQTMGWIDGRNIEFVIRYAAGQRALYAKYAAELASLSPDATLAATVAAAAAVQQANASLPVVFVAAIDPVGAGLVASLSRPGGAVTGFAPFEYSISGKWLELLREIAPGVRWAAIVRDSAIASGIGQFAAIQTVAPVSGMELFTVDARDLAHVERSVAALAKNEKGGVIVTASALGANNPGPIAAIMARHGLPAVYPFRYFIEAGGLVSYGPDVSDGYRGAARYVDRILKGEKPADLPVQAPTKYLLSVNLKAAKAIGLTVPPQLLARADEVIE